MFVNYDFIHFGRQSIFISEDAKCKIETVIATYPPFHSYTHYLETLESKISASAVK